MQGGDGASQNEDQVDAEAIAYLFLKGVAEAKSLGVIKIGKGGRRGM